MIYVKHVTCARYLVCDSRVTEKIQLSYGKKKKRARMKEREKERQTDKDQVGLDICGKAF